MNAFIGFNRSKSTALLVSLVLIFLMIMFFQPLLVRESTSQKTDQTEYKTMHTLKDTNHGQPDETSKKDLAPDLDSALNQEPDNQAAIDGNATEHQRVAIDSTTLEIVDPENNVTGIEKKASSEPERPIIISDIDIPDMLQSMNTASSRVTALENSFALWGDDSSVSHYLETMEDDNEFFRLEAKQKGFMCIRIEGDVADLLKHNLPAVLELYSPGGLSPKFVTVREIDETTVTVLKDKTTIFVAPIKEMAIYWSGKAYLIWKNFYHYTGVIPVNSPRDAIVTLKIHLRKLGFDSVTISPFYDESALAAVREIQKRNGLKVDGIVGPITMIALYNEDGTLQIPHIWKPTLSMPGKT